MGADLRDAQNDLTGRGLNSTVLVIILLPIINGLPILPLVHANLPAHVLDINLLQVFMI